MAVLIVRINSNSEVVATHHLLRMVKSLHTVEPLHALATPQSESLKILKSDPLISDILIFPPLDQQDQNKGALSLREFLQKQSISSTYLLISGDRRLEYDRHVLSLLLCPGERFIVTQNAVVAVGSMRGAAVLIGATLGLIQSRVTSIMSRLGHILARVLLSNRRQASEGQINIAQNARVLWTPIGGLGDLVLTLPALQAFAKTFPYAEIDILVQPVFADFFKNASFIHKSIVYKPPGPPKKHMGPKEFFKLLSLAVHLRKNRYAMAIDPGGEDIYRMLTYMAGIPVRLGHVDASDATRWEKLLTHPVPSASRDIHSIDRPRALVATVGVPYDYPSNIDIASLGWNTDQQESGPGTALPERYAIIHARSSWKEKEWRTERYAKIADHFWNHYRLQTVFVGAKSDQDFNEQISALTASVQRPMNLAGRLSIAQLAGVLKAAAIMFTVDTGPMHVAAALGVPIVSLHLPGSAVAFHAYKQASAVIEPSDTIVERWLGMNDPEPSQLLDTIPVEDVIKAIDARLESAGKTAQQI